MAVRRGKKIRNAPKKAKWRTPGERPGEGASSKARENGRNTMKETKWRRIGWAVIGSVEPVPSPRSI
jgi:hypothetical protein